jgi:hypothetical protein
MPELPTFATEQEAADWFATHSTAPYMDELEEVRPIPVVRAQDDIRDGHPERSEGSTRRADCSDGSEDPSLRSG